ncbi:uncharacterized protein VTP21DRAFT_1378 [Calcarisporiella thermophila]|uniref:uncharacterized protein n=1 Tax=Calcarisporiella thermophila TaxID=911321 RepID=UPI003743697E
MSFSLLHYIKYSLSYLDNRHMYQVVESFAINIMKMQIDIKILRSLNDPGRDKPVWFNESELLTRVMVICIAKLLKIRGQSDLSTELVHGALQSLHSHKIEWSAETMNWFPETVRSYFEGPGALLPARQQIVENQIRQMIQRSKMHNILMMPNPNAPADAEKNLRDYYTKEENQRFFLCTFWTIIFLKKQIEPFMVEHARKVMLTFPPACMSTYVMELMDFILDKDYGGIDPTVPQKLLDDLIWKYQLLSFEHVIFSLTHAKRKGDIALKFLEYLLFTSPSFMGRVAKWMSLGFNSRYWTEVDFHEKLMEYLKEYPEYFEYEAFAMNGYDHTTRKLDPPPSAAMPVYYNNIVLRSTAIFDIVIARLIENERKDLLLQLLEKYGCIYQYHATPLAFVQDLLNYYYDSSMLQDHQVMKRILFLLDFSQYEIIPDLVQFVEGAEFSDFSPGLGFDLSYFEKVIVKLADSLNHSKCAPKSSPNLPERHFREIANPAVQALSIACIEIMAAPVSSIEIVGYLLDITLARSKHSTGIPASVLHAVGLLLSCLPVENFVKPVWAEFAFMISSDPYLLGWSEPCPMVFYNSYYKNNSALSG